MHRSKKSQTGGTSKQDKHINIPRSGEKCVSSTPTPWGCNLQVVTSNQSLRVMDATTQAQAHGWHKARKSLDLERLTQR